MLTRLSRSTWRLPAAVLLIFAIFACLGALTVSGCTGTRAAYKAADTLDEQAYVLTEHYSSLRDEAATLVAKPGMPEAFKQQIRAADKIVASIVLGNPPAVPGLQQLAANYKQIRNAQSEADLQAALDKAIREIANLVRAVKSARSQR